MDEVQRALSPAEVVSLRGTLNAMVQATTRAATAFTFVASFDGTNNDRSNLPLSRTKQATNVGELDDQLVQTTPGAAGNGVRGTYQPGVGTGGSAGNALSAGPWPADSVVAIARRALGEFSREADIWLAANPGKTAADLSTVITGFSRGGPVGIVFAQLLQSEGLRASRWGQVLLSAPAT